MALPDGVYLVVLEPARFVDEVLGWMAIGYRLDDAWRWSWRASPAPT